MKIKKQRILKNGAIAGYVYYPKDRKWKWRILGNIKKKGGKYSSTFVTKGMGEGGSLIYMIYTSIDRITKYMENMSNLKTQKKIYKEFFEKLREKYNNAVEYGKKSLANKNNKKYFTNEYPQEKFNHDLKKISKIIKRLIKQISKMPYLQTQDEEHLFQQFFNSRQDRNEADSLKEFFNPKKITYPKTNGQNIEDGTNPFGPAYSTIDPNPIQNLNMSNETLTQYGLKRSNINLFSKIPHKTSKKNTALGNMNWLPTNQQNGTALDNMNWLPPQSGNSFF